MYRRSYVPNKKEQEANVDKPASQIPRMTLTVEELTDELHISRPTAYELIKQEGFPSLRIGNRCLINRARLQDWLDKQCGLEPA